MIISVKSETEGRGFNKRLTSATDLSTPFSAIEPAKSSIMPIYVQINPILNAFSGCRSCSNIFKVYIIRENLSFIFIFSRVGFL